MSVTAWPFLVGRTRNQGYQVVVSPRFLSERSLTYILAQAAGGHDTPPDHAVYREIHGTKIGTVSIIFRVIRAQNKDYDLDRDGAIKDISGRNILLIEGMVIKGKVKRGKSIWFSQENARIVHEQVKNIYRTFWETDKLFQLHHSEAFNLKITTHQQDRLTLIQKMPLEINPSLKKFKTIVSVLVAVTTFIFLMVFIILNLPLTPGKPSSGIYITTLKEQNSFQIIKLDLKTRKTIWRQDIGNVTFHSRIVISSQVIYLSSASADYQHHYVYALNAQNGQIYWRTELGNKSVDQPTNLPFPSQLTPDPVAQVTSPQLDGQAFYLGTLSTPVIANDTIYVTADSGKLFVLNASNGRLQWVYTAGKQAIIETILYHANPVTIERGIIYGTILNELYALDAKTHKELWSKEVSTNLILSAPQVENSTIYVSAHDYQQQIIDQHKGNIYAFSAKDGSQYWHIEVNNQVDSILAISQGSIYFGADDQYIYALQASDGKERWRSNTKEYLPYMPFVVGNVVYIQSTSNATALTAMQEFSLIALDVADGHLLWKHTGINGIIQSIQGGAIYAGGNLGVFYIYSTKDGSELWHQRYGITMKDGSGGEYAPPPLITVAG